MRMPIRIQDPGSRILFWPGSAMEKFRAGIRHKHLGSATLPKTSGSGTRLFRLYLLHFYFFQVTAITNNHKNGSLQQQQQMGSDPPSSVPPPPPSHSHSFVRSLHSSAASLPVRSGAVPRSQSSAAAAATSPIKFTMSALTTEASVPVPPTLPYRTAVSVPLPLPYRTAAVARPPAEELDEDYDNLWSAAPPPPPLPPLWTNNTTPHERFW
jgi:hypothetical protein